LTAKGDVGGAVQHVLEDTSVGLAVQNVGGGALGAGVSVQGELSAVLDVCGGAGVAG
jgi:hypothetical protein